MTTKNVIRVNNNNQPIYVFINEDVAFFSECRLLDIDAKIQNNILDYTIYCYAYHNVGINGHLARELEIHAYDKAHEIYKSMQDLYKEVKRMFNHSYVTHNHGNAKQLYLFMLKISRWLDTVEIL